MSNSLILYQSSDEKLKMVAEKLAYIVGYSKLTTFGNLPEELSQYENVIFVINRLEACTTGMEIHTLKASAEMMKDKVIGIVECELEPATISYTSETIRNLIGREENYYFLLEDESKTELIGAQISEYLLNIESTMKREALLEKIETFIISHNTLALASGYQAYLRCTPIEYEYLDDCFYIITEGGRKFHGILQNKNVSLGIFDQYTSMEETKGLQIMGVASIVEPDTEEYYLPFEKKGIKRKMFESIPIAMHVIKIRPVMFEYLDTTLRKKGYPSKQCVIL